MAKRRLPADKELVICQKGKKKHGSHAYGGSPTSFWKERVPKNTLNLNDAALVANKASVRKPQNIAIRSLK